MTVLLATPFMAQHADAGLFWLAALGRAGVPVIAWDYRREPGRYPESWRPLIALKTPLHIPRREGAVLPSGAEPPWRVCYWPDKLGRDPKSEAMLKQYDRVYTCLRPTPDGMAWLPTGWDPAIHYPRKAEKQFEWVFIGTCTERKVAFLSLLSGRRGMAFGNGWNGIAEPVYPVYMDDYCEVMSRAEVIVNIHRDGDVGVNRRFFESMAVGFTITDIVPGVEEVLGHALAGRVGFRTPDEARAKLAEFLAHPEWRATLWQEERKVIAPYTYDEAVRRVLLDMRGGAGV